MLSKPSPKDYPEYYGRYINQLPNSGILELYEEQTNIVVEFYKSISEEKLLFRYASNKWSIIEILGHLIDSEIIMGYRALTCARKDKSNLHMYDHDAYVSNGSFDNTESGIMISQYNCVRQLNLLSFKTFTEESWKQKGRTGGKEFITSSIPFIMVGNTQHHMNVIKEMY